MGSSGGKGGGNPQVVPGFENVQGFANNLFGAGQQGLGQVQDGIASGKFNAPNAGQAGGLESQYLAALSGGGGAFQQGLAGLNQGAQGGFLPQYLAQAEAFLQPQAQRSFQRGQADIFETNSALGIPLTSSTTAQNVSDLSGQIQAGVGQNLSGIINAAAPSAIQAQLGASNALANVPGMAASVFSQPLNQQFQQNQSLQQMPFQAFNTGSNVLGQLPITSPSQGKGTGESLGQIAQIAAPILTAYFGYGGKGGGGGR